MRGMIERRAERSPSESCSPWVIQSDRQNPLAEGGPREVIFAGTRDSPRREPATPDSAATVLMPIETLGLPLDGNDEDEEEDT